MDRKQSYSNKTVFEDEQSLIAACIRKNPIAEKQLYNTYAAKLLGIIRRYIRNPHDAEDVLVEALCKIYLKLYTYSGSGSLIGWMKRVAVNESLMFLRKKHALQYATELAEFNGSYNANIEENLIEADILRLLDKLPDGYRTIFNLFVIEGYKHREIAEKLGISINTSKSQLILARKRLQTLIAEQEKQNKNAY